MEGECCHPLRIEERELEASGLNLRLVLEETFEMKCDPVARPDDADKCA